MRRIFGEALMSVGSVGILLIALVALDDRVREQISQRLMTRPSVELASTAYQVQNLTRVLSQAARDQSLEHAPLLIFTLAAAVLTVFMLRT